MTQPRVFENEFTIIARTCLEAYIEHGKALTLAQLHEQTGISASRLRTILAAYGGSSPGTSYTQVEVKKYSKNFPSMIVGHQLAGAWLPSDEAIRAELKRLRQKEVVSKSDMENDRKGEWKEVIDMKEER